MSVGCPLVVSELLPDSLLIVGQQSVTGALLQNYPDMSIFRVRLIDRIPE